MLTPELQQKIISTVREYWAKEGVTSFFQRTATGREIGHRIADPVEERTSNLLESHFEHAHQRLPGGQRGARGMGDIWIKSDGIYCPVNIKSGEVGTNGQPNMVSLVKLTGALARREIDSYYLLFVKIGTPRSGHVGFQVYMVDLLDYLDYMTFNSGPGQIMLREREFTAFLDSGARVKRRTLSEKIRHLHAMLIDANKRLFAARKSRQDSLGSLIGRFEEGRRIDQSRLRLQ